MRDSIALMAIYRKYLEISGNLIEILERHYAKADKNNISDTLKNKYAEFSKHSHNFIEQWNNDLHVLLRIDAELKEIENIEKREKK